MGDQSRAAGSCRTDAVVMGKVCMNGDGSWPHCSGERWAWYFWVVFFVHGNDVVVVLLEYVPRATALTNEIAVEKCLALRTGEIEPAIQILYYTRALLLDAVAFRIFPGNWEQSGGSKSILLTWDPVTLLQLASPLVAPR